jgi:hypothetical protein
MANDFDNIVSSGASKYGLDRYKTPELKYVPLDAEAQGLLNSGIARAASADFAGQMNAGISEREGQLAQGDESLESESAKKKADPAMLKALRDQYNSIAGDQVERIKTQNSLKAPLQKAQALRQYAQAALGQQRAQNSFYQQLTDAYNQQEMGRAQFVNTLFQTGANAYAINRGNANPNFNPANYSQPNQGGKAIQGIQSASSRGQYMYEGD